MASHDEVLHGARMAFLAMSARAFAAPEFDASEDLQAVRLTVSRVHGASEPAIDVEFLGSHSIPIGGMSL